MLTKNCIDLENEIRSIYIYLLVTAINLEKMYGNKIMVNNKNTFTTI